MNNTIYTYLLLVILIIVFVLNPFIKKHAFEQLNPNEFLIISNIFFTTLMLFYALILIKFNVSDKCTINSFKKLSKKQIIFFICICLLSLIGASAYIRLIQKEEITFIMPNVQPIVLLIGAIIGYYLFNESMGKYKISGIILIIIGAFLINYEKNYKL
jgi:drug/metabolite transporter (DMT)-like permease